MVGVIQALLGRLVVFVGIHRDGTLDQLGDSIVDAFLESLGHDVTSALLKDGGNIAKSCGRVWRGWTRCFDKLLP
jgi:hypothetical protein